MFAPSPRQSLSKATTPRLGSPHRQSRNVSVTSSRRITPMARAREPALADTSRATSVASHGSVMFDDTNPPTNEDTSFDIYAKFDEFEASFHGYLPPELQFLHNADFYREEYSAEVDPDASHTLLITRSHAYAWKHTLVKPSTAYIFACPAQREAADSMFGSFVLSDNREPGLLLISSAGEVRHWESLLLGLSGGERFNTLSISLSANEVVTGLFRCSPSTYIVTTTSSVPYRLTLRFTHGAWSLTADHFQRSNSVFSRMTSLLSGVGGAFEAEGSVVAIACGANKGPSNSAWILLDSGLQYWSLEESGREKLLFDEPRILEVVAHGLAQFSGLVFEDVHDLEIELMDITILRSTELVLLISYSSQTESTPDLAHRTHSLVKMLFQSEKISVTQVQDLPYRMNRDLGHTNPRRLIVLRDRIALIHSGDAMIIMTLNGKYNAILPLKSPLDRFLAVGQSNDANAESEQVVAMTGTGMMGIKVNIVNIAQSDPSSREASLLRDIMMQAILYGSHSHNPLRFLFPLDIEVEILGRSAEELSQAILQSKPVMAKTMFTSTLDMQANLADRLNRIHFLADFLGLNGVLTKLPWKSRLTLRDDAEKLFAAEQLWQWFNSRTVYSHASILHDAVIRHMESVSHANDDGDVMRDFFRHHIDGLADFLPCVAQAVMGRNNENPLDKDSEIYEANEIVTTVIRESLRHRRDSDGAYGAEGDEKTYQCPWTATLPVIEALTRLFDVTTETLQERARVLGQRERMGDDPFTAGRLSQQLIAQLSDLARFTFSCDRERRNWILSAPGHNSRGGVDTFDNDSKTRHTHMLLSLADNGSAETAFDLAEDYGEFSNLTKLCQDPHISSPERIKRYIERYGEAFTAELYSYYLENQMTKPLLLQDDKYSNLVDRFFEENPYPRLSWLHDIQTGRYREASQSLLQESRIEKQLLVKHVMLSIGLLSQGVATTRARAVDIPSSAPPTDPFDSAMDYISVQQQLHREYGDILADFPITGNLEGKVDAVVHTDYNMLRDRPAMLSSIQHSVRQVLQGRSIAPQDLIEAICSRGDVHAGTDFASALFLLQNTTDMPEYLRDLEIRTVWRKLFLHDDWDALRQTAGLSDTQINNNLRGSALYKTIQELSTEGKGYMEPILTPNQASVVPLPQDLERRWPNQPSEQLEALVADYEREREMLSENGVKDVFEQVLRLAHDDQTVNE